MVKREIEELRTELFAAERKWKGRTFLHVLSGKKYYVEGVTIDEATQKLRILYASAEDDAIFSGMSEVKFDRPEEEFAERFIELKTYTFKLTKDEYDRVLKMLSDSIG